MSGLFSTHLLSLEALLAVIDGVEQHCHQRVLQASKSTDTEKVVEGTKTDTNYLNFHILFTLQIFSFV